MRIWHRLAWVFDTQICDKCLKLMCWRSEVWRHCIHKQEAEWAYIWTVYIMVSVKIFFIMSIWSPVRVQFWHGWQANSGDHFALLHTKHRCCGPLMVPEDFYSFFPIISLWELLIPGTLFGTQKVYWQDLCRGPLDIAHTKYISCGHHCFGEDYCGDIFTKA